MLRCLVIAGLVAVTIALPTSSQMVGEAASFSAFMAKFGKEYKTEEFVLRKVIFEANMQKVAMLNQMDDGATYGMTQFSDWTEDEFRSFALGYRMAPLPENVSLAAPLDITAAPSEIDWVAKGAVTPVKNQGQCGSCWAFSTTGDIEGAVFTSTGKLVSLSEQDLVDCDKVDQGCQGGLPQNAFAQIIKEGGIDTESSYPYKGSGGQCQFSKANIGAKISSWEKVSQDEDQLAAYVAANGPVSIGINAGPMQWYMGGIANPFSILCNPKQLDHGVLIVGFGEENGKKYWKIKNSWGASWGEKGYYRIIRGVGKCGLNTMATHSKV